MSATDIAKANQDYALDEQRHAMKMFPESKSVGEALAKWYATDSGRKVASAYSQSFYEDMQKRGALGNGHDAVEKASPKRVTNPSHGAAQEVEAEPLDIYADTAGDLDAPVRGTAAWEGEIQRLMRQGFSRSGAESALAARETKKRDVAISKAYRAERGW
jgi:hypothetical protein